MEENVAKGRDEAPGIESCTESDPPIMPDANGQYPIVFPGDHNPFA